ncbi:hypothetical protein M0G43_00200 [Subsaxibacter sp. CAU 1640]|uniref:hypothetical protein n=1 Tax=Subsaxibacter sp. CAU 1640 TaxID=2933271 RepID=UPI00200566CC|nr:hypothetical protein [Subsaxibacter sp. CAU 1640]MCK7588984.1 hypothetical protein [Subsaxibacter sp. CAU 1640]
MKKIITLCLFAFAMVLGTQSINAQSMVEVNSLAAKKTQELKKAVKFNTETEEAVYETYQTYVKKQMSFEKVAANGGTVTAEEKEKVEKMLTEKFRAIFTAEEFQRFQDFEDSRK